MENKFFNDAIIGNKQVVGSFSKRGELLRFCFPEIDGRQFVDFFHCGVKINDSNIIYLHDDINNVYSQEYVDKSNILNTSIYNSYFRINVVQTDFFVMDRNILIRKYVFKNDNSIDLNVDFIVNSKILDNSCGEFASRIIDKGVVQYNHDCSFVIFSNKYISAHPLNDVDGVINSAVLSDKDYIGMSNYVAVSYNLNNIPP